MKTILEQLSSLRIIPVVVITNENASEKLAEALLKAGLPCMEVTFRTKEAVNVIKRVHKEFPEMLIGAGTVLSPEQVMQAKEAGAQFIVSPGLNRNVVERCLEQHLLITPGVVTPTEIETALQMGLGVVKFFPAEACGGTEYLKAISAPYKTMKFIPTGGINESNIRSYLQIPSVLACGGSWMVSSDLIKAENFSEIEQRTTTALALLKENN